MAGGVRASVLALLAAACLALVAGSGAAVISAQGCKCVSECKNPLGGLLDARCDVDFSQCGSCPRCAVKCLIPCVFGRCVCPRSKCTSQCFDSCTPPGGGGGILSNFVDDVAGGLGNLVDGVANLKAELRDKIIEEINNLDSTLQMIIMDAQRFREITLQQLDNIPEAVLSHLSNLRELGVAQIKGLVSRAVDFADENLRSFLDKLDPARLLQAVKAFGCVSDWSDQQVITLGARAVRPLLGALGVDVERIREIGSLARGMDPRDIRTITPVLFKSSVLLLGFLPGISAASVEEFANRAIAAYGVVSQWDEGDWREIGQLAQGLAMGDLANINPDTVVEVGRVFGWDEMKTRQIASAVTGALGDIGEYDGPLWQRIARFAGGLAIEQLERVGRIGLETLARKVDLSPEQIGALARRAVSLFGDIQDWDESDWRALGTNAAGLAKEQLQLASAEGLAVLADRTNLDLDQAGALVSRAKELFGGIETWGPEEWRMLGNNAKALALGELSTLTLAGLDQVGKLPVGALASDQLAAAYGAGKALIGTDIARYNAGDWLRLGSTLKALPVSDILAAGADAFVALQNFDWDGEQLTAIADRAVALYGEAKTWDAGRWREVGALAGPLALAHLENLDAAALNQLDAFGILSEADLNGLRDRIIAISGELDQWTSADFAMYGDLVKGLTSGDLQLAKAEALELLADHSPDECPPIPRDCSGGRVRAPLIDVDFCPAQLEAIGKRILFVAGSLDQWDFRAEQAKYRNLLRGLPKGELDQIPESAIEILADVTCWDADRLRCIADRAVQLFNGGAGVASWTGTEVARLRDLAAGLDAVRLRELSPDAFRDATSQLGGIVDWDAGQLKVLGDQAVLVHGDPAGYSRRFVGQLGSIVAGLSDAAIALIPINALSVAAFKALNTAQKVRALTVDQLLSLSPDQAAAVSDTERESLTAQQLAAVETAESRDSAGSKDNQAWIAAAVLVPMAALVALALGYVYYRRRTNSKAKPALAPQPAGVRLVPTIVSHADSGATATTKTPRAAPKPMKRPSPRIAPRGVAGAGKGLTPARPPPPKPLSKPVWETATSAEGETYFFNPLTNETSWENPDATHA